MNPLIQSFVATAAVLLAGSGVAAGKLTVAREVTVDRPPATVWKLLGDFDALDVWLPPVLGSRTEGKSHEPGAIRRLDLGNNASVTEELLDYSSEQHRYSYAFVASPLPVKNYVATLALSPAPGGRTLIRWHSTFDAAGASDDQARQAIQGIYDAGLTRVATIFAR